MVMTLMKILQLFFSVHLQVVAMMQVGNLPLPLPILTPALHADFPSVHIGIKVSRPEPLHPPTINLFPHNQTVFRHF